MNWSNGRGRFNRGLDADLWRGVHERIAAEREQSALLFRKIEARCAKFLSRQPLRRLVETRELVNAVIDRLISCPTIASPFEVDCFLHENGVEGAIQRMACWATGDLPLLGISQKIAGRRWEQPWPAAIATEALDRRICQDTDMPARRTELTLYIRTYAVEIEARLDQADREALVALRLILILLEQHGLDLSDEPEKRLGMFDELPFGAIRKMANAEGANPQWNYETARNACARLARADRVVRSDAEHAGFGEGPEALLGYLRSCIKMQSPGGGGMILPLVARR